MTQNHRNRQTDRERAGGRPRLLLVKRQGWGFTLGTPTRREPAGGSERNIFGTQFYKFC